MLSCGADQKDQQLEVLSERNDFGDATDVDHERRVGGDQLSTDSSAGPMPHG